MMAPGEVVQPGFIIERRPHAGQHGRAIRGLHLQLARVRRGFRAGRWNAHAPQGFAQAAWRALDRVRAGLKLPELCGIKPWGEVFNQPQDSYPGLETGCIASRLDG